MRIYDGNKEMGGNMKMQVEGRFTFSSLTLSRLYIAALPIPLPFVKPLPKSKSKGYGYGGLSFFPLRDDYLIHSNTGRVSLRGLYLMKGQKVEKVLLGSIHGVSISPDGCKAAFVHARNTEEYLSQKKPYRTVKTINFCEGGSKQ
ncbi:MAG: hypothetical protein EPN22_15040 [Nitrospirae bacterium]|nr:MAG: hypothetical protein EPN22_15040 [Nitrospirota bacterium]